MFLPSSWEIFFLGDVLEIWVLSKQKLGREQGVECASKTRMGERKKGGRRGVQPKKHSACGEDFEDSSGVLCEVLREAMLLKSLTCCGG